MRATVGRILCCSVGLFLTGALLSPAQAQQAVTFDYSYAETGQLVLVEDSTGVVIEYVYDEVGNLLEIRRFEPGQLAVFGFAPQAGPVGTPVQVEGQGFSQVPGENLVEFNGTAAVVTASTDATLDVTVPAGATTGPITVTVASMMATSLADFSVIQTAIETVYDLGWDWSDAQNPNDPWSYNEGPGAPIPTHQDNWYSSGTPVQPAWARTQFPVVGHVPMWIKVVTDLGLDIPIGVVGMHGTSGGSSQVTTPAGVSWTSPADGTVEISGGVWLARKDLGRSMDWTLYLNATPFTGGSLDSTDPYSSNFPFWLELGTGGEEALAQTVTPGDVLELELVKTSTSAEFVGVDLRITLTQEGDAGYQPPPEISSVDPTLVLSGSFIEDFSVTGSNLDGSVFIFTPEFVPPALRITSVEIDPSGSSALLDVNVNPSAVGSFVLVASNAHGSSDPFPSPENSVRVLTSDADEDGDGLSNADELTLGTDPFNGDTDGDGVGDGAEVAFGSDPLDPASLPFDPDAMVSEVVTSTFSALNSSPPPDSMVSGEAISAALSVLNTTEPPDPNVSGEAISAALSVLNTAEPPDPHVSGEVVSRIFSIENQNP